MTAWTLSTQIRPNGLTTRADMNQPRDAETITANPCFAPVADEGNTLFVFGTLKNQNTRDLMLGRAYTDPVLDAELLGFYNSGYLSIARRKGSTVRGKLLSGLTKADMINLDAYESIYGDGEFHFYARELVAVRIHTRFDKFREDQAMALLQQAELAGEYVNGQAFAYTTATREMKRRASRDFGFKFNARY